MSILEYTRQARELDGAFYKTLLESTKAIPWKIDWETMRFTYIGPQIQELLGWSQESWVSVDDWVMRMHPEDREFTVNFCVSQSRDGVDHEADYRALTVDGGYVWIRDVVHVIRHEGKVQALVGFMFDITERKKNEEELLRLKKELEALSYQDGLIGIANRRMFDRVFMREWSNACRNQQPLSLIMLDIDFFKQYNDCYGHVKGDEALKMVAKLLQLISRQRDLAARLGGEEFAILLPETTLENAMLVAERLRREVCEAGIPHARSNIGRYLTVSLGVTTIIPSDRDTPAEFLEAADKLLYRAKEEGRNRVGVPA